MPDQLLEVLLRRLEGVLEGGLDLAIGVGDQALQLRQGGLEVLALLLEAGDVIQRLRVLALGEWVHRAERLAPPA